MLAGPIAHLVEVGERGRAINTKWVYRRLCLGGLALPRRRRW